jgi:4-amino-4-deoxy-L-arabinose transferase-like glycosyltransferase
MSDAPTSTSGFAPWAGTWRAVLLLVLGVTLLRVAYLAFACPYSLIEDEAQYWVWSLHPDWAYSTKGPGVAWAIRAATAILGDAEWVVRLPAALMGGMAMLAVAGLTRDVMPDRRAAFFAAACLALAPVFQALSILMTIDGPLVACWALAAWASWRALAMGSRWAWAGVGAALAAGFLFKFTAILLVPGLAIAWALRGPGRAPWRPGAVLAGAILVLGLLPPIVWNARHDWPTLAHLLGHAGLPGGDQPTRSDWSPWWLPSLAGSQLALVGPALILMGLGWRRRNEPGGPGHAARVLVAISAPVLLFYLILSLFAEPEGNWPVAGWVALMPLAGWGVVRSMDRRRASRASSAGRAAWHWTLGIGIGVALVGARVDLPLRIPAVAERVGNGRIAALTRVPLLASHAGEIVRRQGPGTLLIAQHYGRAAQLWYYLHRLRAPSDPPVVVYCAGRQLGGRPTPWDYWPATDLADPGLLGRAAVVIADAPGTPAEARLRRAFERIEAFGVLEGEWKRRRAWYVGVGYRGFSPSDDY